MDIGPAVWLLITCLPAAIALGIGIQPLRRGSIRIAPWTAVPALAVSLLPVPPPAATVPWLLLDSVFGLDSVTRIFLLFTGLLWSAVGFFARSYVKRDHNYSRFWIFFLLTMAGNFGVIVSLDVASFYLSFALMTLAGYGLIVHEGSNRARHAGQVYITMAILGEVMLISSFMLLVLESNSIAISALPEALSNSSLRHVIVALLLGGFGVKAGVIPLHIWLPLAHPVAPTPASAVLSGAMIKAGLLGWLRFLPLGESQMEVWGTVFVAMGLGAAFAAAVVGVFQKDPKTVLAYSSISQMGIISSAVGVAMVEPETWTAMSTAIAYYALHHGLAKGALFLGVGVAYASIRNRWQRRLVNIAMLLPALSLVGAPLTTGDAAKNAIKDPLALMSGQWEQLLTWLLLFAASGTTVLMARFLYLIRPGAVSGDVHHPFEAGLWAPWAILVVASTASVVFVPWYLDLSEVDPFHLAAPYLWQAMLPILVGLILSWGAIQLRVRGYGPRIRDIPAGDILVLVEAAATRMVFGIRSQLLPAARGAEQIGDRLQETGRFRQVSVWVLDRSEERLIRFRTAGIIFVGLMATLFLLVWRW